MLLKLDHSATTDVPLGISKLLKLLQREVLDSSMINLTKCETMLNSRQLSIEGAWTPCQNELAAGSFTLPVEYLPPTQYQGLIMLNKNHTSLCLCCLLLWLS